MPTAWSVDAHRLVTECPSLVQSMPVACSLSAHLTGKTDHLMVSYGTAYVIEDLSVKYMALTSLNSLTSPFAKVESNWNRRHFFFSLLNRLKAEFNDVSCDL